MFPKLGDAADEEKVEAAERKAKLRADRDRDDARDVLNTTAGRRFIWRWISRAGVFRQVGGSADVASANFYLGQRNLGLEILGAAVEASPETYLLMESEARSEAFDDAGQ